MPFLFKLAKRLACSKAVRTTAARALSALRHALTHAALVAPASPAIRHTVVEKPISLVGPFVVSNALAEEILS
jgi:hypothetical protein